MCRVQRLVCYVKNELISEFFFVANVLSKVDDLVLLERSYSAPEVW